MRYTLDLLPINAFQGRGTPVGGRSLRLFGGSDSGGGYYYDQQAADEAAYQAAMQAYETPAPAPAAPAYEAPAPAYEAPAPEAPITVSPGFIDPGYTGSPIHAFAPAQNYSQTVNDIYQQEFGRQADASGMASFTAQLNQGMTGEQMRQALRSSAEGQSHGLSPAPDAPITVYPGFVDPSYAGSPGMAPANASPTTNPNAGWEWQPPTTSEDSGITAPAYWVNANTGEKRAATGAANIQTVRDEYGNVSYRNADTGAAIDTSQLSKTDKNIAGYDKDIIDLYKNLLGRTPSASEVAGYNKQIQSGDVSFNDVVKGFAESKEHLDKKMPFLDPTAGVNQKFEQGVRGFDAKGFIRGGALDGLPTHYFDPKTGKLAAWFGDTAANSATNKYTWHTADELKTPGAELGLAKESTRDVGQEWRWVGQSLLKVAPMALGAYFAPAAGAGAVAGSASGVAEMGLTAIEAANLMGSTLSNAGAAAMVGGQAVGAGLNWSAIATQAAQSAALNAVTTAIGGGRPQDILKAGLIGAVSGGAGSAIGEAGLGSLGTTLAKAGVQTGITALTGGNIQNSLISSAVGAVLPAALDKMIPEGTFSQLPSFVQNAISSAASRALSAAATGGDVSGAALNGVLSSAAGAAMDYASEATGFKGLNFEESVDKIGRYFDTSGAKDNPEQQWVPTKPVDTGTGSSDTGSDAGKGAEHTPTNTPDALSYSPQQLDDFFASYEPNNSAPLASVASATTSDANPVALNTDTTAGGFLGAYEDLAKNNPVYSESLQKTFSNANAVLNAGVGFLGDVGAQAMSVYQEFLAPALAGRSADDYPPITKEEVTATYKAFQDFMAPLHNLVLKAAEIDPQDPAAQSGLIAKGLNELGDFLHPKIVAIAKELDMSPEYVGSILMDVLPSAVGKTYSGVKGVASGSWENALASVISKAEDMGIVPTTKLNFMGEGNAALKPIESAPLSSSKLQQFDAGNLAKNDPVFTVAESYAVSPRVAANMVDSSAKLGLSVGEASSLGFIDSYGSITARGDTLLNPAPELGQAQPKPAPEPPAPAPTPAPKIEPVKDPQKPANDPIGPDTPLPANDPIFTPPAVPEKTPSRPTAPVVIPPPVTPAEPASPEQPKETPKEAPAEDPNKAPLEAPEPAPWESPAQSPKEMPWEAPEEQVRPRIEEEVNPRQREDVNPRFEEEVNPRQREDVKPKLRDDFPRPPPPRPPSVNPPPPSVNPPPAHDIDPVDGEKIDVSEITGDKDSPENKAKAKKQSKLKFNQSLNMALQSVQAVSAKTPPGAEIDYLYDIGGDSIFAPMKTQSKNLPREGYYDPQVERQFAQGGSVEDLYELLRSK